MGENGAGKSTLVKIIAGLYHRDSGTFELEASRSTSSHRRIQGGRHRGHLPGTTLFPDLSVTENIFMGRQPVGRFGRIDRKAMRTEVKAL